MDRVYIVRWKATKDIKGIYKDCEEAKTAAREGNKKRTWIHKMLVDAKYVVVTFSLK